jgi:hypothetical protein
MKDFSVVMSLVDYIPVALFEAATVLLLRDMYNKMSKGAFALFAAGTIDVICAGILKATYKLMYALGLCDFEALSNVFFPMQSLGFMLAGIGMLALLCHRQTPSSPNSEPKNPSKTSTIVSFAFLAFAVVFLLIKGDNKTGIAPVYFSGTFVFVALMIIGLGLMDTGLCIMSKKVGKPALIALFIVSFFLCLCMGYLSSRDFTKASMNWIAELVNTLGQGTLLIGAIQLHKNGFEELRLHGGETA